MSHDVRLIVRKETGQEYEVVQLQYMLAPINFEYFLAVNEEEVQITRSMAYSLTEYMDEITKEKK